MTTDTSKITGAADELSAGLDKGGTAAKTFGAEIANAIAALDGRVTALENDVTEPPIEPPIEPPTGEELPPLMASGSITATDNQTIENRLITGKITVSGKTNVTIRNCIINHAAGIGIDVSNASNVTIQDVQLNNTNMRPGRTRIRTRARTFSWQAAGRTR